VQGGTSWVPRADADAEILACRERAAAAGY
jgi:hypothetical protein